MDCEKFTDQLEQKSFPYKIFLEMEEHIKICPSCAILFDYWTLNKLTGFDDNIENIQKK